MMRNYTTLPCTVLSLCFLSTHLNIELYLYKVCLEDNMNLCYKTFNKFRVHDKTLGHHHIKLT